VNPSQEPAPPGTEPPIDGSPSTTPDGGWSPEDGGDWLAAVRPRRRPWRRTLAVCAIAAASIAAAGVPLGLLWAILAPSVPVLRTSQGQIVVNDPAPEEFIAADGWFTLLGLGFGVLIALAAWIVLRRYRGPGLLLGVVAGTLGAAPIAWQVGRQIGLSGYERWRAAAAAGDTFGRPPDLHAHGAMLVPAFAAVIVVTLLAGWSNDPDLESAPDPASAAAPADSAISSDLPDAPDPTAAPAPPAPDAAAPPPGRES
jgi:hypothetical protein